ncbi:MAG: hypothetical protein PUP90_16015 [Nostoc sp. S4]|nr:hypothetical protein [Nostoc sp. S4]
MRILSEDAQGSYQFNSQLLGRERQQIALALTTEFTLQEIHAQIKERIEVLEPDLIYQKLQELGASTSDLNHYERKLLDCLLSRV